MMHELLVGESPRCRETLHPKRNEAVESTHSHYQSHPQSQALDHSMYSIFHMDTSPFSAQLACFFYQYGFIVKYRKHFLFEWKVRIYKMLFDQKKKKVKKKIRPIFKNIRTTPYLKLDTETVYG
ncbi:hypothetical protein YC2023_063704 [Brassica napus]